MDLVPKVDPHSGVKPLIAATDLGNTTGNTTGGRGSGLPKEEADMAGRSGSQRIKLLPKDQRIKKIEESLCSWTINLRRLDVHPQFWCRFSTQLNQRVFTASQILSKAGCEFDVPSAAVCLHG